MIIWRCQQQHGLCCSCCNHAQDACAVAASSITLGTVVGCLQARVNVPDDRFTWLCDLYKPKSQVPAFLDVCDIAGLVK
jgi:hypothetical protein